jgi:hypothetical protein
MLWLPFLERILVAAVSLYTSGPKRRYLLFLLSCEKPAWIIVVKQCRRLDELPAVFGACFPRMQSPYRNLR